MSCLVSLCVASLCFDLLCLARPCRAFDFDTMPWISYNVYLPSTCIVPCRPPVRLYLYVCVSVDSFTHDIIDLDCDISMLFCVLTLNCRLFIYYDTYFNTTTCADISSTQLKLTLKFIHHANVEYFKQIYCPRFAFYHISLCLSFAFDWLNILNNSNIFLPILWEEIFLWDFSDWINLLSW